MTIAYIITTDEMSKIHQQFFFCFICSHFISTHLSLCSLLWFIIEKHVQSFPFYNGKSHLCYHVDRLPVNSRWIPLFSIVTPIIQANKINYVMRFHRAFVTKYTNETSPNQAKENMILSHKRKILKSIYHVYTSYDVVKIRIDQKNLLLVLKGQNSQSPS